MGKQTYGNTASRTTRAGGACSLDSFNDKFKEKAAPECCEMCGAAKAGRDVDTLTALSPAAILRKIAEINEYDHWGIRLLLLRLIHPTANYKELGQLTGSSKQWVGRRIKSLADKHPELSSFLGINSPRSRAQSSRRKAEDEG